MGIRVLEGKADGDTDAACMYDSVSGFCFGPIFEAPDAADQIDAFLDWLRLEPYALHAEEIGLASDEIPAPQLNGADARNWPEVGLGKLVSFWRAGHVEQETGMLPVG